MTGDGMSQVMEAQPAELRIGAICQRATPTLPMVISSRLRKRSGASLRRLWVARGTSLCLMYFVNYLFCGFSRTLQNREYSHWPGNPLDGRRCRHPAPRC